VQQLVQIGFHLINDYQVWTPSFLSVS
jgi:hypothetical protein